MAINTRRHLHVAPDYFLLPLTGLPYKVVEIGSKDDLGVMFVTSNSFSVEGLLLPT